MQGTQIHAITLFQLSAYCVGINKTKQSRNPTRDKENCMIFNCHIDAAFKGIVGWSKADPDKIIDYTGNMQNI